MFSLDNYYKPNYSLKKQFYIHIAYRYFQYDLK